MSDKLYAVWPLTHVRMLDHYSSWSPRDAPRCQHCKKVHWLSYAVEKRPYGKTCHAIVADTAHMKDLKTFMERARDEWGIIGEIKEFDNDGVICPRMPILPLRHYWELMERETKKGIGGKFVFPVSGPGRR